jgi:putative colanic acid biosynthesis glycosyltransferase
MFSIITVVLNDPEGLSRTAASIAQQASDNYEWIIIDGGSTDDTLASVEQMAPNMPVIHSGKDDGIYDAMNKGINLSSGDYLIFMNAGDSFADGFVLEALAHCLSTNAADVLLGGTYQHINNCIFYRKPKYINWIVHGLPAFHQSTVYRADLLRKRNYNLAYSLLADYEWLANQCVDGLTVGYLNQPVSNFFVGGSSYTKIRLKFRDSYNVKHFVLKESAAWSLISSVHAIGKTLFVMTFLFKFCGIAKRRPAPEKRVSAAVKLSTEYYKHQGRSR